ncbi:hypothetical protein [Mesorhizobium retamae]|uniref:Helix-turn-helix domain-containing protein n=1 Tax=Mesorhizobium retamae TaxID=2912854 RepID=A0ABS9QM57_9HYPH|nr:hypothetical protein [Mesorhizobium sp. IRAMC:0171]MCG7508525.1 hypothetical protein [Mesorhizobium sp. IRAMC:0171]
MAKKKHDNQGRGNGEGHFFQMYEWFMKTTAWQHASPYERSLYLELKRRYNGRNNGDISLSHREAKALLQCSNTAIENAFRGLTARGFIVAVRKGAFDWKTAKDGRAAGRATRWRLTELPQDIPIRVLSGGTKEFMLWQPGMDLSEKSAVRSKRTNGPTRADHFENDVRSERTINDGVSAHVGR